MSFTVLLSLYFKENPHYLKESLQSVFSQTLKPNEVILVEDGPLSVELYQIIDEFKILHPELKTIPLPKNVGLGKALNEGLQHCSNELVIRMDTDDICKPHRFKTQIQFMNEHPDIAVCSSWIDEFIGSKENIVSQKKLPEFSKDIFQYGKNRCPINHPSVIFRKSKVLEAGGYGPFPEDYYLWGRMMMQGYRLHNIQESLVWFRTSKDVYKRRGGWNYCKAIFSLEKELYRINYLSTYEFLRNTIIRCTVSLIPNYFRTLFYKSFLRN